jgi:sialic acid synthase SpsE/D-lyxose ketol-isomerase
MRALIIFEIANNHMGNLSYGKKIINQYYKLSKKYKKHIDFAFKFQFRDLDTYVHKTYQDIGHSQVERFVSTKLTEKEWVEIISYAKKKFKVIGTAFDEKSVDKIINLKLDYLKIASCSADEWPLLEYISKKIKNKKILSSLGGATKSQIRNIVSFFSNRKKNIQYLYCVAKYPTHPHDLNLDYLSYLRSEHDSKIIGFSSHENPSETLSGGLAYALGARIFEKHVNIESAKYKINKYSTNPKQMEAWIENLYQIILRLGSIENREKYLKSEKKNLAVFKRGSYLKRGLMKTKGDKIFLNDVDFAFPCERNQIASNMFSKFNDFIVTSDIGPEQKILKKDVKIINSRSQIEKIRDKVVNLIIKSKVIIAKDGRIEISHHKGIKNFYKFGLCMITILNSKYCKKLLFIFKNQKHPPQFHKIKQETFFILYGKVRLKITKNKKNAVKELSTGDIVTIYPGEIHSFEGLSKDGAVIEELSTKSTSKDSYYLDKKISSNKNRKSFISLN